MICPRLVSGTATRDRRPICRAFGRSGPTWREAGVGLDVRDEHRFAGQHRFQHQGSRRVPAGGVEGDGVAALVERGPRGSHARRRRRGARPLRDRRSSGDRGGAVAGDGQRTPPESGAGRRPPAWRARSPPARRARHQDRCSSGLLDPHPGHSALATATSDRAGRRQRGESTAWGLWIPEERSRGRYAIRWLNPVINGIAQASRAVGHAFPSTCLRA